MTYVSSKRMEKTGLRCGKALCVVRHQQYVQWLSRLDGDENDAFVCIWCHNPKLQPPAVSIPPNRSALIEAYYTSVAGTI